MEMTSQSVSTQTQSDTLTSPPDANVTTVSDLVEKTEPAVEIAEVKVGSKIAEVVITPLDDSKIVATKDFLATYCAAHPLPEIQGSIRLAKVRYAFFTVYRRLFTVVLTANLIAIIILASRSDTTYMTVAIAFGSNILASVLARHELMVNAVVGMVNYVPLSWPLAIRRRLGKIYCHAGIHSGCGTSAALWYLYFTVLLAIQSVKTSLNMQIAIYMTTGLLMLCLLSMVGLAHPQFRGRHHDLWELSHRYLGWTITALVFVQVFLLASLSEATLGTALVKSSLFWMTVIVICLLIYPWAVMRKRTFVANQLSTHALRLEFDYRASKTGHNIRLSHSPMIETHGFATIPRPNGEKGFSVIISNAGDWTNNIITSENRSNKIWVRGRLFLGIIEIPMLFSPLVIAATGSGIAPCMAFIQTHPEWPVRVVWSARSPVATYGQEIIDTVLRADPNAIIIDTKVTGRPNLPALIYAAYTEIKAEAVLCVSTVKVCESISFEMEARGVPIYVPIFDS